MSTITRERRPFSPDYAVPPGATVADLLEEREMTQTDLAQRLGVSLKHVNQIINGAASISAELALGLEKVFGISAGFWLNRESLHRADLARRGEHQQFAKAEAWARQFPLAELKKRDLIPRDARGAELVAALLRFFGIASPTQWSDPTVAFRKSLKFESDPYALSAWLRAGELRAAEIECDPFDSDKLLGALEEARLLTRLKPEEWQPRLLEACAAAGVCVVVVPAFSRARANGATRWLSPSKALIQLSLRYRWEDIFWFTFFHEAGHVLLHRKRGVFVEPTSRRVIQSASKDTRRDEAEADRFAARTLVPSKYDRLLKRLGLPDIPAFAEQLGIAPAIVVGRLQHDGLLPHNRGNELRRRFAFVDE